MMYPALILMLVGFSHCLSYPRIERLKNCISLDDSIPSTLFRCDLSFTISGNLDGSVEPPVFTDDIGKLYRVKFPFSLQLDAPILEIGSYNIIGQYKGLNLNVSYYESATQCQIQVNETDSFCLRSEYENGHYSCFTSILSPSDLDLVYGIRVDGSQNVGIPYRFRIDGVTGDGYYDALLDVNRGPVNFSNLIIPTVTDYDLPSIYFKNESGQIHALGNLNSPVNDGWFSGGGFDLTKVCTLLSYHRSPPSASGFEFLNSGFTLEPFRVSVAESNLIVKTAFYPTGNLSISFSAVVGLIPPNVMNLSMDYNCNTGVAWVNGVNAGNAGSVTIMVHYRDGPKRSSEYKEVIVSGVFQVRIASYYIEEVWIESLKIKPTKICKNTNAGLTVSASQIPSDAPSSVDSDVSIMLESNPGVESDSEGVLTVLGVPINGYWYIIASAVSAVALAALIAVVGVCVYKSRSRKRLYADLGVIPASKRA